MSYELAARPTDGTGVATTGHYVVLLDPSTGNPIYLTVTQLLALGGGSSGSAPVNSALPAITGTAQVGQTLSASQGTWSNSPTSYAYVWKRAGTTISGATSSTYVPVTADIGNALTVTVTATNASGSASATSSATAAVIAASSGGSSRPALTLTSPVFETASPIYGAKSFKGGTGTATIPVPANGNNGGNTGTQLASVGMRGSIKLVPGTRSTTGVIARLTSAAGTVVELRVGTSGDIVGSVAGSGGASAGAPINDGNKHTFNLFVVSNFTSYNYGSVYSDSSGSQNNVTNGANGIFDAGNATFQLVWSNMLPGDMIDNFEIRFVDVGTGTSSTVAITPDANTGALYDFDLGTGVSS